MVYDKIKLMHKPMVSIIIVNWNGIQLLPDCLGSLAKISYKNIEVIFVDNASKDESVFYVKKYFPKINIIQNNTNLGYAEGHEESFKKAKGELILLLSTDTIVEKNILDELVKAIYSRKNIGAVMPKLLMYPQKNLIDSIGAFFVSTGLLYHYGREKNPNNPLFNKPMEIFSAKGACLLFKKEVLKKTGLFDKDYFAYFEETDLCHRIWLSGNSVLYWPGTVVFHKGGGASKQMLKAFILFHSYKNRLCTYIKNLSLKNLMRVLPSIFFIYQCIFISNSLSGHIGTAFAVQKALLWNIVHLRETLKKRKIVQTKIRTVSDDDFLPKITRHVRLSYYYYIHKGLKHYKD